jgi:16S rRNA (adenine1518-N6/adenine1519-N6)-dimethyltransferase
MRLAQHFLIDPGIAERMVDWAAISNRDIVLEIGPGKGIITLALAKRAKRVIAIELDPALAIGLKQLALSNVEIITGDALRLPWPSFNKVVANLPFNISSQLTLRLLECDFDCAVLIYQREVAERLVARPGDKNYSRLTVVANYHCSPEILQLLPKAKIRPRPKVDCAIVRLTKRKRPFKTDDFFWQVTARLFQHKRKIISAALKAARFDKKAIAALPKDLASKRVKDCSIHDLKAVVDKINLS